MFSVSLLPRAHKEQDKLLLESSQRCFATCGRYTPAIAESHLELAIIQHIGQRCCEFPQEAARLCNSQESLLSLIFVPFYLWFYVIETWVPRSVGLMMGTEADEVWGQAWPLTSVSWGNGAIVFSQLPLVSRAFMAYTTVARKPTVTSCGPWELPSEWELHG